MTWSSGMERGWSWEASRRGEEGAAAAGGSGEGRAAAAEERWAGEEDWGRQPWDERGVGGQWRSANKGEEGDREVSEASARHRLPGDGTGGVEGVRHHKGRRLGDPISEGRGR